MTTMHERVSSGVASSLSALGGHHALGAGSISDSAREASRRARARIPLAAFVVDLAMMVAAVLTGGLMRTVLPIFQRNGPGIPVGLEVVAALIAIWLVVIFTLGGYRTRLFGAGTDEFKLVTHATLVSAGLVGIFCYLIQYEFSRGLYVFSFLAGAPLLVLGRVALRSILKSARRRGALLQRVVLAGLPSHIDEIAAVLRRETWLGYDVVGALTPPSDFREITEAGITVWGNTDDVAWAAKRLQADTVFVVGGAFASSAQTRQAVWDLEEYGVQVVVAPSVTDISSERVRIRPVGGLPLIHLDPPRAARAVRWGKRTFDVVLAAGLVVAFSPILAFAAFKIWAFDRGPVLFRQTRVGKDGQAFPCFKLRTMVTNAEDMLQTLHEETGHSEGMFKMADDPRITAPGHWLRRFSVDELPQLFNVLRGERSLIGPRPPLPSEVTTYAEHMHRRLRVRPGMTGLWQVSGRSNLSFDEAIRLDLYYVDNWSMLQDLSILARTFGAVFGSRGAY